MRANQPAAQVLSTPYALSPENVRAFQRDGHVLTREVISRVQAEQVHGVVTGESELRPFSHARRFGRIAAELLGVPGVRVFFDQALIGEPHGAHAPWHQDQFDWPLETPNTVTMWMPLVDIGAEMGTLIYASGMHNRGPLADVTMPDYSEEVFRNLLKRADAPLATSELSAGDATWHYGWTPHKAPGNVTDHARLVFTVVYMAEGTRVATPRNDRQARELAMRLTDHKPGDLIAGPRTPLVYHRDAQRIEV